MFGILKKKAIDLTVGETFGLSLGLTALCFIPYVIALIVEDGYFKKKEENTEDLPKEITAEDLETSDE